MLIFRWKHAPSFQYGARDSTPQACRLTSDGSSSPHPLLLFSHVRAIGEKLNPMSPIPTHHEVDTWLIAR